MIWIHRYPCMALLSFQFGIDVLIGHRIIYRILPILHHHFFQTYVKWNIPDKWTIFEGTTHSSHSVVGGTELLNPIFSIWQQIASIFLQYIPLYMLFQVYWVAVPLDYTGVLQTSRWQFIITDQFEMKWIFFIDHHIFHIYIIF